LPFACYWNRCIRNHCSIFLPGFELQLVDNKVHPLRSKTRGQQGKETGEPMGVLLAAETLWTEDKEIAPA
jgi:hypothetical protein